MAGPEPGLPPVLTGPHDGPEMWEYRYSGAVFPVGFPGLVYQIQNAELITNL